MAGTVLIRGFGLPAGQPPFAAIAFFGPRRAAADNVDGAGCGAGTKRAAVAGKSTNCHLFTIIYEEERALIQKKHGKYIVWKQKQTFKKDCCNV